MPCARPASKTDSSWRAPGHSCLRGWWQYQTGRRCRRSSPPAPCSQTWSGPHTARQAGDCDVSKSFPTKVDAGAGSRRWAEHAAACAADHAPPTALCHHRSACSWAVPIEHTQGRCSRSDWARAGKTSSPCGTAHWCLPRSSSRTCGSRSMHSPLSSQSSRGARTAGRGHTGKQVFGVATLRTLLCGR